jgi:hypothetical protein
MPEQYGWDERYDDLLACYGSEWLEITDGMTATETAYTATIMRDTMRYAWWRFATALREYGRALADIYGITRLKAWIKRRRD